jgi:6-phosphogluconolactonase (cycloisomerase 2 family)
MTSDGSLVPIKNSRTEFPAGQGPAQIEFSPNGKAVAVTSGFQADDGSRLHVFKVGDDGRLMASQGSPVKPEGATGTVGFSWVPNSNRIYASLFKGSAVIAFDIDPSTAAVRQAGKPVGDDQQAACWTSMTRDGTTLYVGNFVSNSISVYDLSCDMPTLLGSIPRRGATVKDTKDIELSADGKYLYAVGSGARQITVFRVEPNRLLTELQPARSPLMVMTGQNITGLAVD